MLGLTGTTLMRKIDRLEEELGFKLFLRDQSGLSLSDEGRALLFDVEQMERLSFNIFRRASMSTDDKHGSVRVAVRRRAPVSPWVLPRLIDFQKTYRKIMVDLRCAMEQADVSRLEADISIQLERPTNPDLIVTKLGRTPHLRVCASEAVPRRLWPAQVAVPNCKNHRIVRATRRPARRDRLVHRILGLRLAGRDRRHIDQLQRRGSLRHRTRCRDRISADVGRCARRTPWSLIDLGDRTTAWTLWLAYHKEFTAAPIGTRSVIDWLRKIFDPKAYRLLSGDEFIHPNDLQHP